MDLVNLPDNVLFMIFKRMPSHMLLRLARLAPRFAKIIADPRLWKTKRFTYRKGTTLNFYNLFAGPCPIDKIDFSKCQFSPRSISPTLTPKVVEVNTLNLTAITAPVKTVEAVVRRYPCRTLILDFNEWRTIDIAPEAFPKDLQALSLRFISLLAGPHLEHNMVNLDVWLKQVFANCVKLKVLVFEHTYLIDSDLQFLVEHPPTLLEELALYHIYNVDDTHIEMLAKNSPHLKVLGLAVGCIRRCPSLEKLQCLEVLNVCFFIFDDILRLPTCLTRLPKLKTVNILLDAHQLNVDDRLHIVDSVREQFAPHGIRVERKLRQCLQ